MTYTTAADVKAYTLIDGLKNTDDATIEAVIPHAERDVDRMVGSKAIEDTTGLKFDPDTLLTREVEALNRATCAQVEYRWLMGPEFFIRPQYEETTGPDISTKGRLPDLAPAAWRELEGSGLLRLTTTWSGADDPPWASFARNIENDDAIDPPCR